MENITIDTRQAMVVVILESGVVHQVMVCPSLISAQLAALNFYIERDGADESELLFAAKRKLDGGEPMASEELLTSYVCNSEHRFTFSLHDFEYLP